ncbi:putative C2H2 zinc finger domain protein [Aspergillus mulundensis]|uniref:C2H2-type domain-containing protein n=1 Tax=Aspergillus mulundensis TaxID=1810919 RepID=A0A3D8SIR6_9EURO|nr:hypothetical protein DSM5745_02859 [Aspergillus mulundensis]RDW86217.1 hypothetical protein DSM5745_02859 [Aspergillus mulundensis]
MDQGNFQHESLHDFNDPRFEFNDPQFEFNDEQVDLMLQILVVPRIIGPGPSPNSHAGSAREYLEPQSTPYLQAGPSQVYLDPNLAQNLPTAFHAHPSPDSAVAGLEAPGLSRGSSFQSSMGEPQSGNSPYSPVDQSLLNGQGRITTQRRPVTSPTVPPLTNVASPRGLLNALIQIMVVIGSILYIGCDMPNNTQLRTVQEHLQEALSLVDKLISPNQGGERNANDEDKQFRCILCPPNRKLECKNRGTFKRHITSKHYPTKRYFCPICGGSVCFSRKDKHLLHMRQHDHPRLTREEMENVTQHLPPPLRCAVLECDNPISTWEDFIDCLCRHCTISDDWDQGNGSDGDDGDGDDDDNNGDDGDGGGHGGENQYFSPLGKGYHGNLPNAPQYDQYSGNQFGGPSAWGGTGSYNYCEAAPCSYQSFRSLGLEGAATVQARSGFPQPKSTVTGLDSQHSPSVPSAKWIDGDTRHLETFEAELCLRFGTSPGKTQGDLTEEDPKEKPNSGKEAVSIAVSNEVSRELQRLRYFETRVFENQKQGSLLTYVHETLVIPRPGHFGQVIVSSMHEILYQRVEFALEKQPKIPADCLFYLAKEKGHRSSEVNLEATRQASPKKRAHLRVRIKAIAGVLALRAAVSKAPLEIDNTEVSDGWELGIPYPPQEDVIKVLAWLVHVLVFFLRMPPNPKVYVMLASGSLEVPRLN